jgi:MFS family permease
MIDHAATAPARLATRLAFFAAGFSKACSAPLIPIIKQNVNADAGQFGLLLFCLGLGALTSMPITGILAARHGAKPMVLAGGFGAGVILPFVAMAGSPLFLGVMLFLFGAALGTVDVAMNVHGAEVEGLEKRPLMSNFHALSNVGGLCGAGAMTLLLSLGIPVLASACIGALVALAAMLPTRSRLMDVSAKSPEPFTLPRGLVLLLAILAATMFLVEGAVLDWGALLIIDRQLAVAQSAGIGYILFSSAMVVCRLSGGRIIARLGELRVLVLGGIIAIAGILTVLWLPWSWAAMAGFILIGIGAANLVPIVFSITGRQTVMPVGLAVASVTITAYAGVLAGPALVGFLAEATSLPTAFGLLALLVSIVPLTARFAVRA